MSRGPLQETSRRCAPSAQRSGLAHGHACHAADGSMHSWSRARSSTDETSQLTRVVGLPFAGRGHRPPRSEFRPCAQVSRDLDRARTAPGTRTAPLQQALCSAKIRSFASFAGTWRGSRS